jgi:hypothetical protein
MDAQAAPAFDRSRNDAAHCKQISVQDKSSMMRGLLFATRARLIL